MIVGIANSSQNNPMWLVIVGLVGGLIGIIAGAVIAQVVSAAKITNDHVWLKGVHREYLAMLPNWSGE